MDRWRRHAESCIRFGHRRTVGAIVAGLDTVPVETIGDDGNDSQAEIERLVRQRAEKTYRIAASRWAYSRELCAKVK